MDNNISNELLEYFNGDELAASTWKKKYAYVDEKTPQDMHKRMAKEFARIEKKYEDGLKKEDFENLSEYGKQRDKLDEEKIFSLFDKFRYVIPGGSVMSACGTNEKVSLSNCFVIPIEGDSYSHIMKTRSEQVQLMKSRGGCGTDLSILRPRGAKVNNAAKTSTGAASFMDVFSAITNEVAQQGRRGALMLSISINHPDSEEFITKKQDLTKVTGANISVKVSDDFMNAVKNDEDFLLRFPVDLKVHELLDKATIDSLEYNHLYENVNGIGEKKFVKKIKAKELWNTLMHCAWNTAEPGIMFEDAMHNYSPDGVYDYFKMISTNPCFHPDTLIETVNGKVKIKDIKEPTYVYSMDKNEHICVRKCSKSFITKKNAKTLRITLENGSSIMVTPNHEMYIQGVGFVEARKLNIGDKIANISNKNNSIVNIEEGEQADVYDIQVEDTHCLIANGMVAHNCGLAFCF